MSGWSSVDKVLHRDVTSNVETVVHTETSGPAAVIPEASASGDFVPMSFSKQRQPIRLGWVHVQHPAPRQKFGQSAAIVLIQAG